MYEAIKNFNQQFAFRPKIENTSRLVRRKKFVVVGMGGSHLAADLLKLWRPELDVIVRANYGLPPPSDLRERLIIASSYSGNTEEPLDAFREAQKKKLPLVAVSVGGKLLARARRGGIPYLQLPDMHLDPRSALGLSLMALLAATGDHAGLRAAGELVKTLKPASYEKKGRMLAREFKGSVPVIYASADNAPIAYTWKIKFNESSKIPAFTNVFPELNHNEMNGFDVIESTRELSGRFGFLFLEDNDDSAQIKKRMQVLQKLYEKRGFLVERVSLEGPSDLFTIFSSLTLADWTAYHTSQLYGTESEQVPMVEELKRLVS